MVLHLGISIRPRKTDPPSAKNVRKMVLARVNDPTNLGKRSELSFDSTAERHRDVESGARIMLVSGLYIGKIQE